MKTPRQILIGRWLFSGLFLFCCYQSTAVADGRPRTSVTRFVVPRDARQTAFDYAAAQPIALPRAQPPEVLELRFTSNGAAANALNARGNHHVGARGVDGQETPVVLSRRTPASGEQVSPQAYGTALIPFTNARNDVPKTINRTYPSRASGKLFINTGNRTGQCSASLIERGIVVTAAHCVSPFGSGQFYPAFKFVPGYRDGVAPYGVWDAAAVWAMSVWVDGTDTCVGIACQNDVAVLLLEPKDGALPGTRTGWYGFGWDGWGFTDQGLAQITAVGYSICGDDGELQQRNDSVATISAAVANNTLIGSLMCEGSSGTPWLANFGKRPKLTGTTAGIYADSNSVIGLTNWGASDPAVKIQGGSPFTAINIKQLFDAACAASPVKCK